MPYNPAAVRHLLLIETFGVYVLLVKCNLVTRQCVLELGKVLHFLHEIGTSLLVPIMSLNFKLRASTLEIGVTYKGIN